MDFLDTVTGGIENAVGAVLAPVADTAGAAAATLRRELTQTWHGVFGSPTMPGGTNWNAYSHEELYAMVHTGADPGQVGEQAAVLDSLGQGASEVADDLTSRRGQVAEVWEGQASSAFGSTLDEHSAGGAAVAEHAAALSAAVLRASEALSRAQATMPEPVDVAAATSYGAAVPGPNFALGAVTGAGSSWFAASLAAANRKAEAVEVMQAFESSLNAADPPEAPAKLPPGVPGGVPLPAPRPEVAAVGAITPIPGPAAPARTTATRTAGSTPAGRVPATAATTSGAASSATPSPATAATPGTATPSQASSATPGLGTHSAASAAPGAASPGHLATVASGSTGGLPVGTGPSTSAGKGAGSRRGTGGASGWASGPDGRASGRPVAWHDLVGRGGVPGLLTDSDHRPARTAAATGAVPANSRREEDREHHNRMPRADKLFTLDDKTPPPVIGA